jgi:hypothetical protein
MKLFLVLVLSIFFSVEAYACSCAPPSERLMQEAYLNSNIIARATVISTTSAWNGIAPSVRFDITDILKGDNDLPRELLTNYNPSSAACGHDYVVGNNYLIGLYDTRDIKNQAIRGHGYRVVNACDTYYLKHYIETIKEKEKSK